MEVNQYLQRLHTDTLKLTGDVMVQQQNREKDKADILAIEAPGRMGGIQSSLAILHGMDTADETRLEGAKMAQRLPKMKRNTRKCIVNSNKPVHRPLPFLTLTTH